MDRIYLNAEQSKAVFDGCKDINTKECYNNIFKVVLQYTTKFVKGEWHVAYCYMKVFDNVYCRHCIAIDENGQAIDPTLFATHRESVEGKEYLISYVFDDINDYYSALHSNDCFPDLAHYLRDKDADAREWATKNGYYFLA